MDNENETRPLLHSFQSETWRSRARKRCMRIPSEITITGIILGLFLIVVTLLIVLENMETEKKEKKSLSENLLASPMKFNKKVEDKSWQDKKDYMKNKHIEDNKKWDNVNKGWKKLPDISGNIHNNGYGALRTTYKDDIETMSIAEGFDDYGKEVDDSLEAFINLQMSDPATMKKFSEDALQIKDLLHSGIKWKYVDDGWKSLSDQGWKEKWIRQALFKALKEKREELRNADSILQSPMNVDFWDKISDSWKKNIYEGNKVAGFHDFKGGKEAVHQKNINDHWREEMDLLQSPQSAMKKFVKDDEGFQKLGELGWKDKDIEKKLIESWKERENTLQSPMNIQSLWGKATGFLKNLIQKGTNNEKSQKEINNEWANKFGNILQSPKMSYKKWKKSDDSGKKQFKDDGKDKNVDENDQTEQSSMNFDDFLEIIEAIKDHQKGIEEAEKQKGINDEWKKGMGVSYSSKPTETRWKQIDDHWKTLIEHERNSYFRRNDGEITSSPKEYSLKYSIPRDDFKRNTIGSDWKKLVEQERSSHFTRNDGQITSSPKDYSLQYSIPRDDFKRNKIGNDWEKLVQQGLKEDDLKEALYKAWKDGEKLKESAIGNNNMKWKKVDDGWKKISNKS